MALIAACAWSISTVLLSPALERVDVWTASAVRAPLAGVVLWGVAARTRSLPELAQLRSSSLLIIASTGVLNVLSTVCFMLSIATVGAARRRC